MPVIKISGAVDGYAPFDVVEEPALLGDLVQGWIQGPFGRTRVVRSSVVTGPSVTLFVHGVGGSWTTWTPVLQAAAALGHSPGDLLLLDLPGFGESENLRDDLPIELVGEALVEACTQFGWNEIHLVGHSMGGFLALDLASRRPDVVASMLCISGYYLSILQAVNAPLSTFATKPRTAGTYLGLQALGSMGAAGRWLPRAAYRSGIFPHLLHGAVAHPRRLPPRMLKALAFGVRPDSFLAAASNGHGYVAADRWSGISAPLTLLGGTVDQLVPGSDLEASSAFIPNSRAVEVSQAGHLLPGEQPFVVAQELAALRNRSLRP